MENNIPYLEEWLNLAKSGKFEKAQILYFEKLFGAVIENFKGKFKEIVPKGGVLFSVLGFSPEPIILTAKTVEPETHVIFTTNNQEDGNSYLEKYLSYNNKDEDEDIEDDDEITIKSYEMVYLKDEQLFLMNLTFALTA